MIIKTKNVNCNVCGSKNSRMLKKIMIDKKRHCAIVECNDCKLRYLSPRPSDPSVLYQDNYWELHSLEKYENFNSERVEYFKKIISTINKQFPKNKKIKILDVGAGDGLFLKTCDNHFTKYGTELTESTVKMLNKKGLKNIYCGEFHKIDFRQKFDVIILIHVIEHLEDPSGFVKYAKNYLNKNGILVMATPNENSFISKIASLPLIRKVGIENDVYIKYGKENGIEIQRQRQRSEFGKRRFYMHTLQHFYYFTEKSMSKILKKNGFKKIRYFKGYIWKSKSLLKKIIQNQAVSNVAWTFGGQGELFLMARK